MFIKRTPEERAAMQRELEARFPLGTSLTFDTYNVSGNTFETSGVVVRHAPGSVYVKTECMGTLVLPREHFGRIKV